MKMLLVLFLSALQFHQFLVHALPSDMGGCSMIDTAQPGGVFGEMSVTTYSTSTTGCAVAISGGLSTYVPCQTYTLTVTSTNSYAQGVSVDNGAITNKNLKTFTNCGITSSKVKSATYSFKAPASGNVIVSAICGTTNVMYSAPKLTLTKDTTTTTTCPPTVQPTGTPGVGIVDNVGTTTLSIQYEAKGDATLFTLKDTNKGWIGIGLPSGTAMVGGKSIIGMNPTSNSGYSAVQLYSLTDKTKAGAKVLSTDATLSSTYGIYNASFTVDASASTLSFSIIPSKQSPDFMLISKDKPTIMYATGADVFNTHSFRNTKTGIDFSVISPGGNNSTNTLTANNVQSTVMIHGALMIISYCIMFPFGAALPLFNNKKYEGQQLCGLSGPTWFKAHKYIQMVSLFFAMIAFFCIIAYDVSMSSGHFDNGHKGLGLFLILGSIANPVYGYFRPHKPAQGEIKTFARFLFEWAHPLFGYLIIFLGILNCYLGVDEFTKIVGGTVYQASGQVGATGFSGSFGVSVIQLSLIFGGAIVLGIYSRVSGRAAIQGRKLPFSLPQFHRGGAPAAGTNHVQDHGSNASSGSSSQPAPAAEVVQKQPEAIAKKPQPTATTTPITKKQ